MAESLTGTQVEVAGQIVCALIQRGYNPTDITGDPKSEHIGKAWGNVYEIIYKSIIAAKKTV